MFGSAYGTTKASDFLSTKRISELSDNQIDFLVALENFISNVKAGGNFRGKTQVLSALRRISNLAVFTNRI